MIPCLLALLLSASAQDSNIEEHLGAPLPLASTWKTSEGATVRLGDLVVSPRPTVLVLQYFACPMLCGMVLDGVGKGLDAVSLTAGKDYNLLSISFDPRDTPQDANTRRAAALARRTHPPRAADWPFLTGSASSIDPLLSSLGVHLWRDPQSGEYAHPAAIFILTPEGAVAQYLYGVRFTPEALRQAIAQAREGITTSSLQHVFLRCFAYHPAARRFAPLLAHVMRLGGAGILATLGASLVWLQRRAARRAP